MTNDFDELLRKALEYVKKHGTLPPALTSSSTGRLTKREENEEFLNMSMEQKVASIAEYKAQRYRRRWIPNAIKDQIDMTDSKEVAMWKAVNFKQRFPFLKNPEMVDHMTGTVLFTYRVAHGVQVTDIDASEEPMVGQVIDFERIRIVWVEMVDIVNRTWKEIES